MQVASPKKENGHAKPASQAAAKEPEQVDEPVAENPEQAEDEVEEEEVGAAEDGAAADEEAD